MGLSAFSRARVSMLPEMELEAKRFDEWNKMHQATIRAPDDFRTKAEEKVEDIRKKMLEGVAEIGGKVTAGLAENTKKGDPIDLPLRTDHVRDMVGRRHIEDPQGTPKSTIERLHDRIPTGGTASEKLIKKTDVEGAGPTEAEIEAATEEQQAWEPELPEAGEGAGVKGNTTKSPPSTASNQKPSAPKVATVPPKK